MIDEKTVEDAIAILKKILPSVNEKGQWLTHITDEKDIERLTALFFALRVLETYLATAKEMPKKRTCLLHSNNSGEKCDCCKNCIEDNKIIDECSIVTTRLLAEKDEIISCLKSDLCEIGKSLSCNEADEFGLEDILSAISEKDIEIVSCHKEIERLKKINSEVLEKLREAVSLGATQAEQYDKEVERLRGVIVDTEYDVRLLKRENEFWQEKCTKQKEEF